MMMKTTDSARSISTFGFCEVNAVRILIELLVRPRMRDIYSITLPSALYSHDSYLNAGMGLRTALGKSDIRLNIFQFKSTTWNLTISFIFLTHWENFWQKTFFQKVIPEIEYNVLCNYRRRYNQSIKLYFLLMSKNWTISVSQIQHNSNC